MNRNRTRLALGANCGARGAMLIEGRGVARIGRVALLLQQAAQRHGPEPDAALLEEPAPGDLARVGVSIEMILAVHDAVSPPADVSGLHRVAWARKVAAHDSSSGRKGGLGGWP